MISNIPSIRTGGLSLETVSLLPWIVDLMKVPGQKEWEHRLRWHLGLCVSVVNVQNRVKNVALVLTSQGSGSARVLSGSLKPSSSFF